MATQLLPIVICKDTKILDQIENIMLEQNYFPVFSQSIRNISEAYKKYIIRDNTTMYIKIKDINNIHQYNLANTEIVADLVNSFRNIISRDILRFRSVYQYGSGKRPGNEGSTLLHPIVWQHEPSMIYGPAEDDEINNIYSVKEKEYVYTIYNPFTDDRIKVPVKTTELNNIYDIITKRASSV